MYALTETVYSDFFSNFPWIVLHKSYITVMFSKVPGIDRAFVILVNWTTNNSMGHQFFPALHKVANVLDRETVHVTLYDLKHDWLRNV